MKEISLYGFIKEEVERLFDENNSVAVDDVLKAVPLTVVDSGTAIMQYVKSIIAVACNQLGLRSVGDAEYYDPHTCPPDILAQMVDEREKDIKGRERVLAELKDLQGQLAMFDASGRFTTDVEEMKTIGELKEIAM